MDKALFNGWFRKNYFIPSIFLFSWAELFHASLSRTYLQQVRRICSRLQSPFPKPLVVLSSQLIHCVPEWVRLPLSRNCTLHSYPAIVSQQIVHRFEVMCTVEKHFLHDDDYEWRRLIYEKLPSNTRKTTIWSRNEWIVYKLDDDRDSTIIAFLSRAHRFVSLLRLSASKTSS